MIRVEVFAEQPLHLGSQLDAGWLTDTHRFVPGSVLRGALAALWLAEHRPPKPDTTSDMEFQRLFEGGVRFGPLYPSDNALRPLSVFGCKYADDDTCRRFSHDAAFDGAAPAACPVCGSPVEASKGGVDGVRIVEHTRVQLDEHERAADGQLYTRRALPAGTQFTGLIDGDPDGELAWLVQTERSVLLGGRRSTSGLATLSARAEASPPSFTGFVSDQRRLVVRLLAPGIFVDTVGRPSWLPDVTELSVTLGVPVAIDAAFARPTVVSGWHAVSNLPKPRDFAVAAGSVFVLRFDAGLPDHAGLRRLWQAGLGLRRTEGNGWITLQRWNPPVLPSAGPKPALDAVHELFVQIVGYGIGPTIVDDLRGWAQQRHVGAAPSSTAEDILAKQRYLLLSPAARDAVRAAFTLPADDAERLARLINDWTRARTSTRGRTA